MSFKDDVKALSKRMGLSYSFVHEKLTKMRPELENLALEKKWGLSEVRALAVENDFEIPKYVEYADEIDLERLCDSCSEPFPAAVASWHRAARGGGGFEPSHCGVCVRAAGGEHDCHGPFCDETGVVLGTDTEEWCDLCKDEFNRRVNSDKY